MRHILAPLIENIKAGKPLAIASIVKSAGSAPRTSGARMLLDETGILAGTVGGGAVEAACEQKAYALLKADDPDFIADFDLSVEDAANLGMVCGGAVSVLIQKVQHSDLEFFSALHKAYHSGSTPLLITLLPENNNEARFLSFFEAEALGKEIFTKKTPRQSLLYEQSRQSYFIEPLFHPGTVRVMGGGHVGLATAGFAKKVGFNVVVVDDRSEFANIERFPEADAVQVLTDFSSCCDGICENDYVVIVTRGHIHDRDVLAEALRTPATYIGMIGSSRKRQAVYDSILENGFTEDDLTRVSSPIGLTIGADTPEEIGISIVAELIAHRAKKWNLALS